MTPPLTHDVRILVMGAGISGLSAAQELAAAGVGTDIVDMGENPGGRLAVRNLIDTDTPWDGHIVDVGAAYFTTSDDDFTSLVRTWMLQGLVREWFDTATVIDADGRHRSCGPMRYATKDGLRSLARAMIADVSRSAGATIRQQTRVTQIELVGGRLRAHVANNNAEHQHDYDAVILACPDAQAVRVLDGEGFTQLRSLLTAHAWLPVITHTMVFAQPQWAAEDFWFVNDSDVLTTIADDGARRGDGAAVLVAHSTPSHAAQHLDQPDAAAVALESEVGRVLNFHVAPAQRITKRWGLAQPAVPRTELCGWDADSRVAVCGDGWAGKPRIEGAWLSGRDAARQVLAALAAR